MQTESQILAFLQTLDYQNLDAIQISDALKNEGFTSSSGSKFSIAQVNSLLHSLRQAKRKAEKVNIETCGIDREANPCGDASDY